MCSSQAAPAPSSLWLLPDEKQRWPQPSGWGRRAAKGFGDQPGRDRTRRTSQLHPHPASAPGLCCPWRFCSTFTLAGSGSSPLPQAGTGQGWLQAGGCAGGSSAGSQPVLGSPRATNPSLPLCPGRFWFRLYWFPLKVLYATCHSSLQAVPDIPFYFFFNALLLILTLMNIYWFLVRWRGRSQHSPH